MAKRQRRLKLGVGRPPIFADEPKQRVLLSMRPALANVLLEFGNGSLSNGIELAIDEIDLKKVRSTLQDARDDRRQKFNLTLRPSTIEKIKDLGEGVNARGAEALAEALERKLSR